MRYFTLIMIALIALLLAIAYFAAQKKNIYEPYEARPRVLNESVWPDTPNYAEPGKDKG